MKQTKFLIFLLLALCQSVAHAQTQNGWTDFSYNLSLQSDQHLSVEENPEHRFMSNNYASLKLRNRYMELGTRFEYLQQPLPGFNNAKGWGFSTAYLKFNYKGNSLTLGDVYGQFGSGMLLRLYEDRALGIDNALRGAKLVLQPFEGIRLKLLGGQQRNHFDTSILRFYNKQRGYLLGGDLEYDLQQHVSWLREHDYIVQLGASYVSKYDPLDKALLNGDGNKLLNQPERVGGFSSRLHLMTGAWDLFGEYAYKANDPIRGNDYAYNSGSVAMLNLSYADNGLSLFLGARRSENFDFRSMRTAPEVDLRINHLLPFTLQQTYSLAALYPYATQSKGEWAFQGEVRYTLKRKTWYGGRYGTHLRLSASYVRGLQASIPQQQDWLVFGNDKLMGTNGIKTAFFGMGPKYFHDFNVEISRKFSKSINLSLIYMNQAYNQRLLEGHAENGDIIKSNIYIFEGKFRLSKGLGLRTELQYLQSDQAKGDWIYSGVELSILPHFLISMSDQANLSGRHYLMYSMAATYGNQRVQLSFGETRKGINCSGGVCRMMPATKGFNINYLINF